MFEPAISLQHVGKMYKVFTSRRDALLDAIGLPTRRARYREFWALRGIDLELAKGERLGIIGRNGAGKSTLLKLITQNVSATEGVVRVNGNVQALIEIGGGLHPEFTGRENIHAALALLGLPDPEIEEAEAEIAEFTELGRFLDQPFKTYSLGMQARLAFAVATTIEPEILIVDEVLGAGDAFFLTRSLGRMRELIEGGASVLLVSHAMEQVTRFCDKAIWLDRGSIVMQGPTLEVVKAYEKFVRETEERRLQAKNQKLLLGTFDSFERESYADVLSIRLSSDEAFDVRLVSLLRNGSVEDEIAVGSPQDVDQTQSGYVVAEDDSWGAPEEADASFHRTVRGGVGAEVAFKLWFFYPDAEYRVRIEYRASAPVDVEVVRGGSSSKPEVLPATTEWTSAERLIARSDSGAALSQWRGADGLRIDSVRILGGDEQEHSIFQAGSPLTVVVRVAAVAAGTYKLIPAILVFRSDGIVVTRHVGEELTLGLEHEDAVEARLDYGPLMLGDGTYHVSVGIYRELDINNALTSEHYDYFDRSFEFQVVGSPPLHNELVRHPGRWQITAPDGSSKTAGADRRALA